jgi:hypothetical protein
MRVLRTLILALLCSGAVCPLSAGPPASVGASFLNLSGVGPFGLSYTYLFYLGADGTCRQLLTRSTFDGNILYNPSQSGTYTYLPTPGNTAEATLTTILSGTSTTYVLEYNGDTSGFVASGGPLVESSDFTFLLATPNTFLTNVSNRVSLRPADVAVTGFVISGSSKRLVLIRAVGPTLAQFGVSPVALDPALNLFSGIGTDVIASGQAWGSVTGYDTQSLAWIFGIAGAFPLESGSSDQVYFGLLAPGTYTAQVQNAASGAMGGSALTEVYILPYSG